MKKAIIFLISFVLIIAGGIYICCIRQPSRSRILLESVGITDEKNIQVLKHDDWTDVLSYVSGYEILAAKLDPLEWNTPQGWNQSEIAYNTLFLEHDFAYDDRIFQELNVVDTTFQEWIFIETGRNAGFKNWEYSIGMYNGDGLLLIYRGHDLNSDIWMLI